jgi:hypothetical protein
MEDCKSRVSSGKNDNKHSKFEQDIDKGYDGDIDEPKKHSDKQKQKLENQHAQDIEETNKKIFERFTSSSSSSDKGITR